jgi:5-formyltetrahydrofolate cyclo-ligase
MLETETLRGSATDVTAGELREQIWSDLVRLNACAFPIPPHGHNPNFKGARGAARNLMLHPLLSGSRVALVGMEAALLAVREEVLASGKTLIVPHRTKAGAYWRLEGVVKAAAKIANFSVYGAPATLEGVEVCVLASVAVDARGRRLSKGFGFGSRGAPVDVPVLTVAHKLMVRDELSVPADSRVVGCATAGGLVDFSQSTRAAKTLELD